MCVANQVAETRAPVKQAGRQAGGQARRLNYQMPFSVFFPLKVALSKQNKYLVRTEEAELNSTQQS